MVHVEYVGSKPQISYSGVSFEGKQDKYNFIQPSVLVVNKLLGSKKELSSDEVMDTLYTLFPDFDEFYEEKIDKYKHKLDLEEDKVQKNIKLNDVEKNVLLNNYKYMRSYRVQRATNKLVYEEIINASVKLIKDKKIENIKTPFSLNLLHVLKSLDTTMQMKRVAMSTKLDVNLEEKNSYVQLIIRH